MAYNRVMEKIEKLNNTEDDCSDCSQIEHCDCCCCDDEPIDEEQLLKEHPCLAQYLNQLKENENK